VLALSGVFTLAPSSLLAQDDQTEGSRKVMNKVMPTYPSVARTMGIRGSVKVEVQVAPNGTVKSVEVKGGHPMLAQAAADAVRKWKWVPATRETKEPVIVKFDPSE
jgi:TonB family protein